jgi:DNA-binding NtrC family response regulator
LHLTTRMAEKVTAGANKLPSKGSSQHPQAMPTVLIVEDDLLVARAVGRELNSCFHVRYARTAAEAKAALSLSPEIAAAVCDLHLAGAVDGVAVLAEARRRNPSALRVILSGDVPSSLGPLMVSGDVQRYIAKPWEPGAVRQTLEDALSQ